MEAFNSGDPRKVATVTYHEDCHVMPNGMETQHGREGEHSAVKDVLSIYEACLQHIVCSNAILNTELL